MGIGGYKMEELKANEVLDAKGLACPMPIVKTKKAMNGLAAGFVLEVQATDKGSKADMKAWAASTGNQYLGMVEDGDVLKHFIRKATADNIIENKHPFIVDNEELEKRLKEEKRLIVLDVREAAEYAFNHIPTAISIPLGELDERFDELNSTVDIFVICRTGSRSDLAAQKLAEIGFTKVFNVVPGMSQWTGATSGVNSN